MAKNSIYNCESVNRIRITEFLERLGYRPQRIRGKNYWYCSPLRDEKNASFKVDTALNCWFDFGTWEGGSLVDFGIAFYHCSTAEFLHRAKYGDLPVSVGSAHTTSRSEAETAEGKINILEVRPALGNALEVYLISRAIPSALARRYCVRIHYEIDGRNYFAIGFKNDAGGYELRSKYVKLASSPKSVTTIRNGASNLSVFEGFFDFLSFMTLYKGKAESECDFLILNSAAFFEKAIPFMDGYEQVDLYLDQDATGQNCSAFALSKNRDCYQDKSSIYTGYKDLNEWLVATSCNTS